MRNIIARIIAGWVALMLACVGLGLVFVVTALIGGLTAGIVVTGALAALGLGFALAGHVGFTWHK